uniref:PQQ-like beta-propeller repeat protein n=1 Tax=Armatimonas sp. TaxID=1872638 RepID=UPI00375391A5
MSRFLGALLVLGVLVQVAWAQLSPPFHKTWETKVTDQLQSVVLDSGTLYYGTSNSYGALEQVTGKRLWEVVLPEKYFGTEVAFHQGTLYVAVGMQGLQGCDPKTGKTLWSVPSSYYPIPPSRLQDRVFATPREGFLSAIHTTTHYTLWTRDLRRAYAPQGNASMHGPSVVVPLNAKNLLVGTYDAEVFCLDALTGKPRWRTAFPPPTYRGEVSGITVGSRIYVSHDGTLEALSPQTGRILWRFTREDDFSAALELPGGRLVVMTRAGMLYIVGADDGKLRGSVRVARDGHTGIAPPRLLGSQLLVGADEKLQAFDVHGKQLWEWPLASPGDNFINTELPALFPEPRGIVVVGFHELVHFSLGAPAGAAHDPAERRAQAQELMAHLDDLSFEQKRLLTALGDEGFETLLPLVKERIAKSKPKGETANHLQRALETLSLVVQ